MFGISPPRTRCVRFGAVITAAILAALSAPPTYPAESHANEALPELGDSAAQVLSPGEEERIGRQFMRQVINQRNYVDDRELIAYLNQLGGEISVNAALRGGTIKMHLLQHPNINAFALPGGHLAFHTGLVLASDDEDELASVVAHEIAHISQRHLPRMLAKAEASKLPAAAAIMASILLGGKAGIAGLTVANATLLSSQLAYSREFEREADAIGLKLLAEAEYDPGAMARFFHKLERYGGIGGVPEFLRTHPLTYTRMAEAESRAGGYPTPPDRGDQMRFYLARAKIRALYSPRNDDILDYFAAQAAKHDGARRDAAVYGTAMAQLKLRKFDRARATLQPLLAAQPDVVAFQLARAEIDLADGRAAEAAARHGRLSAARPDLPYLTHYHAGALLADGRAAEAKRVLRRQLRRHKEMFALYPLLSKSNVQLGLLAEAHQATAEFHAALDNYPAAAASLKLALREADEEGYLHESLRARLKQVQDAAKRAR
ncbi:MAG: M48 family metalloprotease [Gammaproteobacteria bacterium]|nr:M48 family metalloprotease [Gammaproteobacteria bacterium]MDA7970553.1 M48 family metalloprotease [Gammaproteobacteria bacterium]MDA7994886.1 M48 family metalloprotease [Gammaproteobacteria bacterium]